MNTDSPAPTSDEYLMTALQIFDYCGAENSGTLRVDALMDKFAPFVKTNKAKYSYLRSLLDPEENNPEINVTRLAKSLHKYSESQKPKHDLEESFNLKTGQAPQDSDSGISTDGFQLLEELQCELREKMHQTEQLRNQLDYNDAQHEEAIAALVAERDTLRAHLNMLRDENMTLTHVRRDYEEVCDRLASSEVALVETRRDLDCHKRRHRVLQEQVVTLENEKLTLQELLTKSKDECHRTNEMYASRQSALLEQNETLKSEHAELTSRLQDQEEFMQQIIKEKVLLEMELKDLLNKSNQAHFHMNRSIDVSYTDDQNMLNTLDSLNAESRFSQDNRLLDEESFLNALKEDHGRSTNISLFDEIRFSVCNLSRHNVENIGPNCEKCQNLNLNVNMGTQTEQELYKNDIPVDNVMNTYAQTEIVENNNNNYSNCTACKIINNTKTNPNEYCVRCQNLIISSNIGTQTELQGYKDDFDTHIFDHIYTQTDEIENNGQTEHETYIDSIDTPNLITEFTQIDENVAQTENDSSIVNIDIETEHQGYKDDVDTLINTYTQTDEIENDGQTEHENHTDSRIFVNAYIQTDVIENNENNNHYPHCPECEAMKKYTTKLEKETKLSHGTLTDMQLELSRYEDNLDILQKLVDEGDDKNILLQAAVQGLEAKLCVLEVACAKQRVVIDSLSLSPDTRSAHSQTNIDQISVSTQVDVSCTDCEKRSTAAPQRSLRKYLWEPLKCLFQVFAVVCFVCAVSVLYGITRRWHTRCREAVPWRWFDAQELMDMLLRIEYVADVPM